MKTATTYVVRYTRDGYRCAEGVHHQTREQAEQSAREHGLAGCTNVVVNAYDPRVGVIR